MVDLGIDGLSDYEETGPSGLATVYTAMEAAYGRRVAVKVFAAVDDVERQRFDRERLAMGQVSAHPNIVTPLRGGYSGDRPYLVMEHLGGGSLQDRLDQGPLPWDEAIEVVLTMADALGHSHQAGVVHKDVKPASILLTGGGEPKLSDFEAAVVQEATVDVGQGVAAPHYAAPETFLPGAEDRRDHRSDLWSLAATLYALGTGAPPFGDDSPVGLINQIMTAQPAPTGRDDLDRFFATALAKDPDDRYQSAPEWAAALEPSAATTPAPSLPAVTSPGGAGATTLADPPVQAPSSAVTTALAAKGLGSGAAAGSSSRPPRRRRRWLFGAVAASVLALAGAIGALFLLDLGPFDQSSDDAEAAPATTTSPPTTAPTTTAPEVRTSIGEPTIVASNGRGPVRALAVTADGQVASGGQDGTVQIWDPADPGGEVISYLGHTTAVGHLLPLDDGRFVSAAHDSIGFSFGRPGLVQVWDPGDPTAPAAVYDGHSTPPLGIDLLPDGRVASLEFGAVHLWDPADPAGTVTVVELAEILDEDSASTGPLTLDDGRLAIPTFSGTVYLWDPTEAVPTATYTGHDSRIVDLAQLADGRVVTIDKGEVQIWDPADPTTALEQRDAQFADAMTVAGLSDGRILIGDRTGPIAIWDPAEPDTLAAYIEHVDEVTAIVELDNGVVASASVDGSVWLWDPSSGGVEVPFGGHIDPVVAMAALDDGQLATIGMGGTVVVWDPDEPAGLQARYDDIAWTRPALQTGDGGARAPLAPLGGGRLALVEEEGTLHLWSVGDPEGTLVFGPDRAALWVQGLSGGRLASAGIDSRIQVWDPTDPTRDLAVFTDHELRVAALAELSDGRIVSADAVAGAFVWDPEQPSAAPVTYTEHASEVSALAGLSDGRVASGDEGGAIHLWDPDDPGVDSGPSQIHDGPVNAIVELADGRVISGGDDGTVAIWDPADPSTVQAVYAGHNWVSALAELADGRIVSAGGNGVHLWLPPTKP